MMSQVSYKASDKEMIDRGMYEDEDWPFDWHEEIFKYFIQHEENSFFIVNRSGFATIAINTNDTFAYATADMLVVEYDELASLWKWYSKYPDWGILIFAMTVVGMKPLKSLVDRMKAELAWEDWMSELEDNADEIN